MLYYSNSFASINLPLNSADLQRPAAYARLQIDVEPWLLIVLVLTLAATGRGAKVKKLIAKVGKLIAKASL